MTERLPYQIFYYFNQIINVIRPNPTPPEDPEGQGREREPHERSQPLSTSVSVGGVVGSLDHHTTLRSFADDGAVP